MNIYDATTMLRSYRPVFNPAIATVAYHQVHVEAFQRYPVIAPDDGRALMATFFDRQSIMLPIVPQQLFIEHRELYFTKGILKYAFSLSLEYAIYSVIADVDAPEHAEQLASKAKVLLDMEISGRVTTLGSIQASVLLGWRECGSHEATHYCATAAGLTRTLGTNIDPSEFVSTTLTLEEMDTRRFTYWSFFVFDKYFSFAIKNLINRLCALFQNTSCILSSSGHNVAFPDQVFYSDY